MKILTKTARVNILTETVDVNYLNVTTIVILLMQHHEKYLISVSSDKAIFWINLNETSLSKLINV